MPDTTTSLFLFSRPARRRARQGQSVVVALLVLLLLGLVGALFVTVVARNLVNARHANRVVSADYYAKAGITFADAQLTYSPDGADWRPPLQNQLAAAYVPMESREASRYAANTLSPVNANDPDITYLQAGFTRYNTGAGRFLLRVTYAPVIQKDATGQNIDPVTGQPVAVPPGRYLKIEAIGREGVIDPIDPTTYTNNRSTDRTQAYQVAYKPIGITDYARFETNIANRSDIANLGVVSQLYTDDADGKIATPGATDFNGSGSSNYQIYPVITTYGAADALLKNTGSGSVSPNPYAGTGSPAPAGYSYLDGGASLRANMSARFYGKTIAYMNNTGTDAPAYQDTFEIAGNLLLDSYDPTILLNNSTASATAGQRAALSLNPTDPTMPMKTAAALIAPSNAGMGADPNPPFDTHAGLFRDGSMQNDINGLPRAIKRLEPPQMDSPDPATSLPRYKVLAMTSPPRLNPATSAAYTGAAAGTYGYGRSLYINNPADVQPESVAVGGGTTLTDEWLNTSKAAGTSTFGGWKGDLYDPVGANITLGMQTATISGAAQTFAGIRLTRSDNKPWTDSTGAALPTPSPDGNSGSTMYVSYDSLSASNDPKTVFSGDNLNNDVLIYAEGNVRVHGIVSPDGLPRHVTIVTGGTAYIDGNILKGTSDSSITILAHDYVCVNTTQFLVGPQPDVTGAITPTKASDGNNYYTFDPTNALTQELNFGLATATQTAGAAYPGGLHLYISGRGESGSTGASAPVDFSIINAAGTTLYANTASFSGLAHETFSLPTAPPATTVGGLTQLDVAHFNVNLNPGAEGTATSNFLMERAAVLPMDIRIEAVLYAQTRSFFVIPGPSFNSDTSDTLDAFAATTTAANPGGSRPTDTDSRFPLYGQPIDMKIVVDGAVSEAQPANINAQTAWMLRWGWIPLFHGTMLGISGPPPGPVEEDAGHSKRIGLQLIYNPQAGYPYNPDQTSATSHYYLRSDQYGRPLPYSPRLPVSTALLYAGESGEAPLLQ